MADDLQDFSGFSEKKIEITQQAQIHNANMDLLKIRNQDYEWRVNWRPWYGATVMLLLIASNLFVFWFILHAYFSEKLCDYEWLFATFFVTAISASFLTANFFIKWLFSEIPYQTHTNNVSINPKK